MARFIRFPWATTGDRVEPPFPTDPGGTASYSQGFGPNYELPNTDPNYEPVPRDLTNGFYLDRRLQLSVTFSYDYFEDITG